MCNNRIALDSFNPEILFVLYSNHIDTKKTSYHCHDFIELSYIISGDLVYNINDKHYPVSSRTLIPCNPGVYHQEFIEKETPVRELYIGLKGLKVKNLKDNFIISNDFQGPFEFHHFSDDFHDCCLEIIKEQQTKDIGSALVIKSLVMKLIAIIIKELNYDFKKRNDVDSSNVFYNKATIVNMILDYLDKNYMTNISLDDISKNFYVSSVYISKIFKERMGESPINYLIHLRLSKSIDLLKNSTLSIKEIADSVGYKDAYYFSKLFKKYYGISPSKYKSSINSYY